MAFRFVRLGTTQNFAGPNDNTGGLLLKAGTPVPAGQDDPSDYSNLDVAADSDPVFVGDSTSASVWFFSDTTSTSSMRAYIAPTPTGPWLAVGSAATNAALATPAVVDIFAGGRAAYVKVTTASCTGGNPRALLVADNY